jgi:organic hydroperoxide reductase OsmC/OhrA
MGGSEFRTTLTWVGNDGSGTSTRSYAKDGELAADGRPTIPTIPPDGTGGWSPEHLLLGSVSQCHMLWYLHLCARNGVVVESYEDSASCRLVVEGSTGSVRDVTLHAVVEISSGDPATAREIFDLAGEKCYVARSLAEPVAHSVAVRAVAGP